MISLNWVKDYIDLDGIDLKKLAVDITKAGINVEKVITNQIDGLKIGKVIECSNHPDSDHMHVCKVDIGNEVVQIVCGAQNVCAGIKVIVATNGTKLPGGVIKKTMLRGVESNGMICALFELGLEEKTDETYNKGITILGDDAIIGQDPLAYLGLDDTLYELDVHKHRNNDCYYHIGFAYEIACILNKKVKLPQRDFKTIDDNINNYIKLDVKTEKCPFYLARMVKNVTIKESPDFIKKRLISAGMRPINNVVDISNYVMLEYGQPTHFFDKDKLGNKILVRNANPNEQIITLDGQKRDLLVNDIVITDGEKPVCIAGVMGGENTEVTSDTKNILIESAIFDSVSIRYTASNHNLKSEASIRYGKGLSYEYTKEALDRCCHLLEKYANASVLSGTIIHDELEKNDKKVTFKVDDVNKMLGINISTNDMEKELDRLDFKYTYKDGIFECIIPNRRLDIEPNVNDLAEEIGRLYGYENLKSTLPHGDFKRGQYVGDVGIRKNISKRLRNLGLNEVKTYTLVSPNMANAFRYENKEQVKLPNPMSIDKSVVRTTLIPSLLNIYDYNKARKVNDILIYEIAKTYDTKYNEDTKITILMKGNYIYNPSNKNLIKVDFYLIKGILENLLDFLGFKNRYSYEVEDIPNMHPNMSAKVYLDKKPIGIIGRVHPTLKKDEIYVCEISLNSLLINVKPVKYKQASIYPAIEKDMAFVVDKSISAKTLINQIKKSGGRLLTDIDIFDVYTGENVLEREKSIAFKLTFSDNTRTLSDEEVMNIFNKIIEDVTNNCNAKLRSN